MSDKTCSLATFLKLHRGPAYHKAVHYAETESAPRRVDGLGHLLKQRETAQGEADKALALLKSLRDEISRRCTHRRDGLVVEEHSRSDTLGTRYYTTYYLKCPDCNKVWLLD